MHNPCIEKSWLMPSIILYCVCIPYISNQCMIILFYFSFETIDTPANTTKLLLNKNLQFVEHSNHCYLYIINKFFYGLLIIENVLKVFKISAIV